MYKTRLFKVEDLKRIVFDDFEGFETIQTNILDEHQWYLEKETIVKEVATGKLYCIYWDSPTQEDDTFEDIFSNWVYIDKNDRCVKVYEVKPVEEVKIEYVYVEEDENE